MGEIPVLFVPNLPEMNFWGPMAGAWYPDTKPSGDNLETIQKHLWISQLLASQGLVRRIQVILFTPLIASLREL
jgi:hypothetical protein